MSYPNFSSYFNPRGKTRFYITLPDLYNWAYIKAQDPSSPYAGCLEQLTESFDDAQTLFNGSLTYYDPQRLHKKDWNVGENHPPVINYPTIFSSQDQDELINYYFDYYDNRPIFRPVEIGRFNPTAQNRGRLNEDEAIAIVLDEWCEVIKFFVTTNKEKYLRLLALLNLQYNPIDNYDKVEYEDFGYEGEEKVAREVKANQLGGIKITGPTTDATISTDPETGLPVLSGSFDTDYRKGQSVAQVGDTQQGQKGGVPSISGEGVPDTTTIAGTGVETDHYTTTYDDAARSRLESYDEAKGTVATTMEGVSEEDYPTIMEATSGAPNHPSYDDTKSFTNRKDKRDLQTWGNAGTTMTQDMIMKEQQMLKEGWNVVKMFCEELNKEIFLQCYDY